MNTTTLFGVNKATTILSFEASRLGGQVIPSKEEEHLFPRGPPSFCCLFCRFFMRLCGTAMHKAWISAIVRRLGVQNQGYVTLGVAIVTLMAVLFSEPATGGATRLVVTSKVSVETDRQEYQQGEEVIVSVTNNLETPITTFDQQAFCSIIRLEQHIGEQWKEVRNCFSGAPSQNVMLEPSSRTVVKLPGLPAGVYRAALSFSLGRTFEVEKSYVSFSLEFTVR